jgi:glycosyltransferase involved in cell wall biosynthesis
MNGDTARFIESRVCDVMLGDRKGRKLEPDLDHLIHLMFEAVEDTEWRNRAARVGTRRAAKDFSWDRAVERLLNAIFER